MAKIPFTFGTGILSTSSVRFAVYSFSASNVSLSVDGGAAQVLTMTGYGTDGNGTTDSSGTYGTALYVATVDLTGLSQARHALSVTQDGVTRLGATNPDRGDITSKVIFLTCDSYASQTAGVGAWKAIRAEIEAGDVQTIIHTDDHGYTAGLVPTDTGAGGTGRYSAAPNSDWTEYSRYLAYAAYFGLLETDVSGTGYVPDFHELDRIWCRENCPQWASVGDWELNNNPAEDATITAAQIATAKNAYLNTVGATNAHLNTTNSAAWVQRVGPLEVTAFDRCFALTPLTQYYDTANEANNVAANKLLGDAQISDIKAAIDSTSPFKVVAMSMSAKHMSDASFRRDEKANGWIGSSWFGGQQPLHDYTADTTDDTISYVSEWRSLMTASDTGIAAKAQAYNAPVIGLHGDTHRPYGYWHYFPQDADNVELDMLECSAGAVCPAFAHRLHPSIKKGYYYRGTIVEWLASWTEQTPTGSPTAKSTYLSISLEADGDMIINYVLADGVAERTIVNSTTIARGEYTGYGKRYRQGSL